MVLWVRGLPQAQILTRLGGVPRDLDAHAVSVPLPVSPLSFGVQLPAPAAAGQDQQAPPPLLLIRKGAVRGPTTQPMAERTEAKGGRDHGCSLRLMCVFLCVGAVFASGAVVPGDQGLGRPARLPAPACRVSTDRPWSWQAPLATTTMLRLSLQRWLTGLPACLPLCRSEEPSLQLDDPSSLQVVAEPCFALPKDWPADAQVSMCVDPTTRLACSCGSPCPCGWALPLWLAVQLRVDLRLSEDGSLQVAVQSADSAATPAFARQEVLITPAQASAAEGEATEEPA